MKTILCYGDSNTHGCNPECDIRDWTFPGPDNPPMRYERWQRWTGVLAEILGSDYYVIEEGLPGRTTVYEDAILPFRCGKDYIIPCLLSHCPIDLLVIMLGTNDVKALYSPSEITIATGFEEFLKVVLNPAHWDSDPAGKVLLVAPPPIRENIADSIFYGMVNENSVRLSRKLGNLYQNIAQIYKCAFLDAGDYIQTSEVDCIHMTVESHKILAEAIGAKIKMILKD
jgi:lysophospholipase L1-like esterase